MPKGKRHGNLSARASKVYEDIRQEHPTYSKSKAARISNAVANGTVNHKRGRMKKR